MSFWPTSLLVALIHTTNKNCTNSSSRVGTADGAHDLEQCSFARTAWTHDTHYLVWLNVEVDAFEHFQLPERLMYVVKGNHCSMCKCVNVLIC